MSRPLVLRLTVFLALSLVACPALADVWDFRTPEYWASTGLDSIEAAEAYSLGFTGMGVIIGVVDTAFAPEEGEFAGKYPYGVFGERSLDDEIHGVHVSGIMVARKDDYGMHGVAFDARLLPWGYAISTHDGWAKMLEYPEVRIVNNSWGGPYHLDSLYPPGFWVGMLYASRDLLDVALTMAAQDTLMVVASGNEGHLTPSFLAALPTLLYRLDGSTDTALNWLNVTAYNPAYAPTHPSFVSFFSNLGQEASEYTLMAPGGNIYSTISPQDYMKKSGTSSAAPYVSGVAALAQQAFPYMGGKQLADVLLSTATPVIGANQPRYFVLLRRSYDENAVNVDTQVVAYSTGTVSDATDEEKEAISRALLSYSSLGWDADDVRARIEDAIAHANILSQTQYDELFGQGMVNAHKAVQGPGYFNAERLDEVKDLARDTFGDGNDYAMYGVDSQGYDSVWGNDIGERRADFGALKDLSVGLRKDGAGLLFLTGANSYAGPTEVRGGGISLGTPSDHDAASLAGDVYVRDNGLLQGAGRIGGNLYSTGTLSPGFADLSGTSLSVAGSVTSSGVLRLALGQNGLATGLTSADMDLGGTTLRLDSAAGQAIEPYTSYLNVLSAPGGIHGLTDLPSRIAVSPFLAYNLASGDGTSLSLIAETSDLDSLPGLPSPSRKAASALQHLFTSLSDKPLQDQLDHLYGLNAVDFADTAAAMRGDIQAATLTSLPFTGMLQRLVAGNPLGPVSPASEEPKEFSPSPGPRPDGGLNLWMRPLVGWFRTDGQSSLRQDPLFSRMCSLAAGLQRDGEDWHAGVLLAFGNSELDQGRAEADILDARLGLYGGFNLGGLRLTGLLSGGWQHYTIDRYVPTATGRAHLKSSFDGYSLGLGAQTSYNLLHGVSQCFALSPYAGFDADYIRQEGRKESGSEVFALDIKAKDYWRTAILPGLRLDFAPLEWLSLTASAGYKRLVSGHNPSLDVGFRTDSSYRFNAVGADEGRDRMTCELGIEAALPRNVTLAARFFGESSTRSQGYSGYLNMIFAW